MTKFALTPAYSSGAVIQRDAPHVFWGSAPTGATVTAAVSGKTFEAVADQGKWQISFGPLPQGGPYSITIKCDNDTISLDNVHVGDVWLVAGQSNAHKQRNAKLPAGCSFFTGYGPANLEVYPDVLGQALLVKRRKWIDAGKCSIAGAAFAEALHAKTHVPIGIVNCAFPGSPIQSWYKSHGGAKGIGGTVKWIRNLPPAAMAKEWVYPLNKMPIRGVLWWQGESNIPFHADYADHLKQLILEWRSARNDPFMPFVIIQLQDITSEDANNLSAFRIAQARAANEARNCIIVPVNDLTMTGDLHPPPNELIAIGRRCAELCVLGVVSKVDD